MRASSVLRTFHSVDFSLTHLTRSESGFSLLRGKCDNHPRMWYTATCSLVPYHRGPDMPSQAHEDP